MKQTFDAVENFVSKNLALIDVIAKFSETLEENSAVDMREFIAILLGRKEGDKKYAHERIHTYLSSVSRQVIRNEDIASAHGHKEKEGGIFKRAKRSLLAGKLASAWAQADLDLYHEFMYGKASR